jgi:hypothetical protein
MEWLDVIEMMKKHRPVEDVDTFMNYVSKWPLFIHLISAAICLGLSTIYHLFFVYSPKACLILAKLDYTGITILFFGSTVPFITYMFACNEVICKSIRTFNEYRSSLYLHNPGWRLMSDSFYCFNAPSVFSAFPEMAERRLLPRSWCSCS